MPDEIGIYAILRITAVAAIPRARDPLGRDHGERIFLNILSHFPEVTRDHMEWISCDPCLHFQPRESISSLRD